MILWLIRQPISDPVKFSLAWAKAKINSTVRNYWWCIHWPWRYKTIPYTYMNIFKYLDQSSEYGETNIEINYLRKNTNRVKILTFKNMKWARELVRETLRLVGVAAYAERREWKRAWASLFVDLAIAKPFSSLCSTAYKFKQIERLEPK